MQARLYRNPKAALRDNFVFFGFTPYLNPAFVKVGPSLEIQPLSVFNLRIGVELMQWFGTFKFLQSFGSPRDDFSDSTINKRGDAGGNYVTNGARIAEESGIDPSQTAVDLTGFKASLGLSRDVESLTHQDLQKRREIIRTRLTPRNS